MRSKQTTTGLLRRSLSFALALVMLLGMLPMGILAAENDINIRIHYYSDPSWGWTPAMQYWQPDDAVVSDYEAGPTEIPGWGGAQGYTLKSEGEGWYSIVLTGTPEGFQFLNMADSSNNTSGKGYISALKQYNGSEPTDLYCKWAADESGTWDIRWYVDQAMTTPVPPMADAVTYTYTVHYLAPDWTSAYAYGWGNTTPATGEWPGMAIGANADHEGWYDVQFTCLESSIPLIFNNNSGTQTDDLTIAVPAGATSVEAWVTGVRPDSQVSYTAPEGWTATEPADSYYLVGYINNADYYGEDHKFQNGKVTLETTAESYVMVQSSNGTRYMTDGWQGKETTSVTLKDAATLTAADKLYVPAGQELEFTLAENEDGTLTLSYTALGGEPEITPIAPEKIILAGNGGDIGGGKWLNGSGWAPGNDDNKMAEVAPGVYEITYTDLPNGKGYAFKFAANGDWNALANWGGSFIASGEETAAEYNSGSNITFDVLYESADVTIRLDLTKCDATTKNGAKFTITIAGKGDLTYTANLYFQKPADWGETVNAWIWGKDGAIPGYEQYNTNWPGPAIEKETANPGWYKVSLAVKDPTGFSFLFNDGTNQTTDLATGALEVNTDLWIVDGAVIREAPAGWVDPNRTIHVPGTFPGPSWDASSNQMRYDPELGLYVYTFENVPAANYEYKISINGSWNENYGAGGVRDGSNMAVAVRETMDVTVYYNDNTHNSVTNVTYLFADVSLTGTGIPAGTKLLDKGLTGIYSALVPMTAGTYEDIQLTCNGETYTFAAFELKADKDVTFYFDPATGIYYHDGSDAKVGEEAIFYDSGDTAYKAPFGAVAQGEDVTFAITTGEDVTQVKLVVKGVGSFDMAQPETAAQELGTKRWTCTTQFDTLGEYDYYFAISNGSDVKVYGDDDGYYGTGKVSDLTDVQPYDLVVYAAGFQTPDWMKDAVVYQIFPDRFFDGDPTNNLAQTTARGEVDYEYISDWYVIPENPEQEDLLSEEIYKSTGAWYGDGEWSNEIYGGDLEGIVDRIDYLKALGVNVIYLNPVFASISSHRYDACDYTAIDPILGTLGDFEELVAVAEANDMHIILDGVFNHVSDDSVYFDRYYKFLGKSEKIGAYPYWAYVYDYMAENNADQATGEAAAKAFFSENYGITDWSYTEWFEVFNKPMADAVDTIGLRSGKPVYSYDGWWGYDSMPIIYSTNGSEYQTGNWAEEIINNENGDSVTQYWIAKGNDGWRLDVANEVSDETWQNFRKSVKAMNSDAVIVGEIWDDATKYLMGDMYDSVMNYLFRNAVTGYAKGDLSGQQTTKELEKIRERYPEEAFYAMMNLVGSHDTTRLLSYLDGIGDDRNQKDLESAFPTYEKTSEAAKQMQYLVAFLQFTYPGAPTIYYGDEIGMVGADDPDDRRAMEWGKGNQELVEWYAKLAAIRASYPALRTGTIEMMDMQEENMLGFTRSQDGVTLAVYANNSAKDQVAEGVGDAMVNMITGEIWDGVIPARSGVILVAPEDAVERAVDYAALAPAYDPAYTVPVREGVVNPFTDVDSDDLCYEAVLWAAGNGVVQGTSATTFSPEQICSRGQLVTFLWRANGSPKVEAENPFVDVAEGDYYYQAILWAVKNGITNGVSADRFDPHANVTQGQVITFLWRDARKPASTLEENPFADVAENAYYYNAILWAHENGIANGTAAGTFGPDQASTRSQSVVFLHRYFEK